jgi:hypothetical protein
MKDGWPLSWRHYVYGMAHLNRDRARESLRIASAAGVPHMKEEDARRWFRAQSAAAGR